MIQNLYRIGQEVLSFVITMIGQGPVKKGPCFLSTLVMVHGG